MEANCFSLWMLRRLPENGMLLSVKWVWLTANKNVYYKGNEGCRMCTVCKDSRFGFNTINRNGYSPSPLAVKSIWLKYWWCRIKLEPNRTFSIPETCYWGRNLRRFMSCMLACITPDGRSPSIPLRNNSNRVCVPVQLCPLKISFPSSTFSSH